MGVLRTILALLALVAPGALHAQQPTPPAEPKFEIRRVPRAHRNETNRYRELGVGELGFAFSAYYTARSYNISDISGLDNSLATSWLYSFDPWGLGSRAHIEWRITPEWRLSFMPRADVAFGILNASYDNIHDFNQLSFSHGYRGANDVQKLSLNLEFEFSTRWRWLWWINKFNAWMVFRRRDIRANEAVFRDPQLGAIDRIRDRERVDWEQAYLFGSGTGVGFEFFFVDESYRFLVGTLWRPFNQVVFRDKGGITNGFEIFVRSVDFELTNQVGLYFEAAVQAYLPTDEFNDIYYTQFSIGVRFR